MSLHASAKIGDLDALRAAIGAGGAAICDGVDRNGDSALHSACLKEQAGSVEMLLQAGASPDIANKFGNRPLFYAAGSGCLAAAALLLDTGRVEVAARNRDGETALSRAAAAGHAAACSLLLRHGSDPDACDGAGRGPLHRCCERGHAEAARVLLDAGAAPSIADAAKRTPVQLAAALSHVEVALLLLERGADARAADADGRTPLHFAAARNCEPIADALVKYGADSYAETREGERPVDCCPKGSLLHQRLEKANEEAPGGRPRPIPLR